MTVDERIERAVEHIRAIWGICTAVGAIYVMFTFPWWAIPLFVVFSIGTYFGSLFLLGLYLAAVIKLEDHPDESATVDESAEGFTKENTEAVGFALGSVANTGEAFGRYLDEPMFEWIDVIADNQGNLVRYVFEQVTTRDNAGNLLLPRLGGHAFYKGVTYKLSTPL